MFTGIVEEVGRVRAVAPQRDARRLAIAAERVLADLQPGDSIALDGVCQTVVALEPGGFAVETIGTTLSRTTLGGYHPGRRVNLERPVAVGERLGGHFMHGHVDGVGVVETLERCNTHVLLDVRIPDAAAAATVLHGSIAINGVSLTVNALPARGLAQVALIPFTWEHTNLSDLQPADAVNIEGDLIGKMVVHHLERSGTPEGRGG